MAAGQETREEQRRRSSFGEVSRAASTEHVAVSAADATKVRKRARDAKAVHEEADARAAMRRGRCHAQPLAAFTGRQGPSDGAASAPPGIALVKVAATAACAKLREHNFKVSHDPIDFIDQVLRSRARSPNRGHLVLASAVAHMILPLLPGCWQYSWALTWQIPRISFGGGQSAGATSCRGTICPGRLSAWLFQLPSASMLPRCLASCSGLPRSQGPICNTSLRRSCARTSPKRLKRRRSFRGSTDA